jgi:hypothetical protein
MIRPGNFFPLLPATARYLRIDRSMQKIDRTIRPQRPHDSTPTTARFNPNDRTIQPQRLHTSVKAVRRLFPLPFIFFCRKRKKASGFFKNVSDFKRKHFGE